MSSVSTDTSVGGIAPVVPIVPSVDEGCVSKHGNDGAATKWSYDEAFKRNRGLITEEEQKRLRNSRVAIAGMGGVGGVHLVTLARLGIGKFTIADPDVFEVANFNRQYGATVRNLGRNKAEAMAEAARDINPELDIRVMPEAIDSRNIDRFYQDADLFVDSLDAFSTDVRRPMFRMAASRGIYAIGVGPVGFSCVWVVFAPKGMSFDDYFALGAADDDSGRFVRYIAGMAPRATHRAYVDPSFVDLEERCGPSVGATCQLASGVLAVETVKILLGRGRVFAAPHFHQFDPYTNKYVRGRLRFGNRGLAQQIKTWYLRKVLNM